MPGHDRAPYSLDYILASKIFSLLHDPLLKPYFIRLLGHMNIAANPIRFIIESYLRDRGYVFASRGKLHEIVALYYIDRLLSSIIHTGQLGGWLNGIKGKLYSEGKLEGLLAVKADGLASGFDRIVAGIADIVYRSRYGTRLSLGPRDKIFNIFNPRLIAYSRVYLPRLLICTAGYELTCALEHEFEKLIDCLRRIVNSESSIIPFLRKLHHGLFALLEPMFYNALSNAAAIAVLPADTRVPTHTVLDHLYASTTAANIVVKTEKVCGSGGDSYHTGRPCGVIVYVGLPGVAEWLAGSRKLSDLWVASWLATSIVWYAVKELVWCLGPDILLLPDPRWSLHYASLLEEKLGELPEYLREALRDYRFHRRGPPLYAWMPASAILTLPALCRETNADSECSEVVKELGIRACSDSRRGCRDAEDSAKNIIVYLYNRIREAWGFVVDAILDGLGEPEECSSAPGVCELIVALKSVKNRPPFQPIIVSVAFAGSTSEKLKIVVFRADSETGQVEELENVDIDRLLVEFDLARPGCGMTCEECRDQRPYRCYHIPKLAYALAFHKLMQVVERLRAGRGLHLWLEPVGDERPWRYCTVCRVNVAVYRVPGREEGPSRFSREYLEWAYGVAKLLGVDVDTPEEAARILYPVFRPGERLCPYCLVKRLAGLPGIFSRVAEKLYGRRPEREVRFPSTPDVAWLAGKLALLKAVELAARYPSEAREAGLLVALRELAEGASRVRHRSRRASDLLESLRGSNGLSLSDCRRELVEEVLEGFWWTPWLLYTAVKRMIDAVRSRIEKGDTALDAGKKDDKEKLVLCKAAVAAALLAWMETRDIAELYPEIKKVLTRKLPEALRGLARVLRDKLRRGECGDTEACEEAVRAARDSARALSQPRDYYALIALDYSGVRPLLEGYYPECRGHGACPRLYLEALLDSLEGFVESKKERRAFEFFREYLLRRGHCHMSDGDRVLVAGERLGVIPVSPSYHRALSSSIGYTLLRSAIVAERLGGIPVYMAGDEVLVLLPGWLPPSLNPYAKSYGREALRALKAAGADVPDDERFARMASWSPFLLYTLVSARIAWGSSSRYPGFHPVKKGGRGRTVSYIPALVPTPLRYGIVVAHRRDHLYAVIEQALILRDTAPRGKAVAHLYYGRVEPSQPAPGSVVTLSEQTPSLHHDRGELEGIIRRIGWLAALAALLNGAIEEGILSGNMPYDTHTLLPGGREALEKVAGMGGPAMNKALLVHLTQRNLTRGGRSTVEQTLLETVKSIAEKLGEGGGSLLPELTELLLAARQASR